MLTVTNVITSAVSFTTLKGVTILAPRVDLIKTLGVNLLTLFRVI
jgi:hypothetical protein